MTKRLIWTFTTLLIILAMVLPACNKAAPATQTKTSADTPKYGGVITFVFGNNAATSNIDPVISSMSGGVVALVYDKPVSADWGKGPEGTNEYPLNFNNVPLQYRTGVLLTSWEIKSFSDEIWHVRKGVHFQNKPPANGREMTSADIVYTFQRGQQDTRSTFYNYADWNDQKALDGWYANAKKGGSTDDTIKAWQAYLKSIKYPFCSTSALFAIDQYTVEYKIMEPFPTLTDTGNWIFIQPTESKGTDLNNFQNACGTGPYIISELVQDSSVTFTRNPDYFMMDPNHPANRLPYADKVIGLVLPDPAAQLAALRTGKVTLLSGVAWDQAATLKKTNPELLSKGLLPTGGNLIFMRSDLKPFSDVRVRQALNMAVDRDSIINDYFKGNAVADAWPCLSGNAAGYTPIDKMPANVAQYFQLHLDKARQLLADAGYADGLTVQVDSQAIDPSYSGELLLIQEQWAKINVKMDIKTLDATSHTAELYAFSYPSMIYSVWSNGSLQSCMGWAHGGVPTSIYAFSKVVDPIAVEVYQKWVKETDQAKADAMIKEEYLREDILCWEVSIPVPVSSYFWQPYLGGFHGELTMGIAAGNGETELLKFLWLNQ